VPLSVSTGRHLVVVMPETYIKGTEGAKKMGTAPMYLIPAVLNLHPTILNLNLIL
jgi:hypothetical protein